MRLRRGTILYALAMITAVWSGPAVAVRPDEMLSNPVLEARARSIGSELRCLVCQNESIDDSDADLAHDLRMLVRQRLLAGDSDEQVKQYIVDRYGNYVLLKPPFEPETYLLWFGPVIFIICGAVTALVFYRRSSQQLAVPLSQDEARRVATLIDDKAEGL